MGKAGMFGVGAADAARGPGLSPGLGTVICAIHTWCSQPHCAPQDEQEKRNHRGFRYSLCMRNLNKLVTGIKNPNWLSYWVKLSKTGLLI